VAASAGAVEWARLDRLLAERSIRSVYQPIVELDTGAIVAYEALARGPAGDPLETPNLLFEAAGLRGQVPQLDEACREAAFAGARAAGMRYPWTLFVNFEPAAARSILASTDRSSTGFPGAGSVHQVVMELTERELTARPAELLQLVAEMRAHGWGVALDDVGADPNSLALLPLLRPDVIKLDLSLVQQRPSAQVARIVSAVNAEAERSGSVVLAEGIESAEHLTIASSLGATLGQGYLLGRPGPLPSALPSTSAPALPLARRDAGVSTQTPYEMAAAVREPRTARKLLLIEISKHLERSALEAGESVVVLSTFQEATFFTPTTRRRYMDLAARSAFVGALGAGMQPAPAPGVRGARLDAGDPLLGEWDIAVVGPHFAATLVARDLGDSGPDAERRFSFVLSHDRELAVSVALMLMSRMLPEPTRRDRPPNATQASGARAPLRGAAPSTYTDIEAL